MNKSKKLRYQIIVISSALLVLILMSSVSSYRISSELSSGIKAQVEVSKVIKNHMYADIKHYSIYGIVKSILLNEQLNKDI